jgi:hypothetical protein
MFFAPELYEKEDFLKPPISLEQELHRIYPKAKAKSKNPRSDKLIRISLKNGEDHGYLFILLIAYR